MDRYYQEQLQRLREGAGEFARRYPAIAPMLLEESGDPDVERILEGTAWLCAKIHERLDRTAPELVQSLLRLLFPQSILPVPAMTLLRFTPRSGFTEVIHLPAGTEIASHPVDGVPCIFGTTNDLDVLPLAVRSVQSEVKNTSEITVRVRLALFAALRSFSHKSLIFYLTGSYAAASARLMALLTKPCRTDVIVDNERFSLPPHSLTHYDLPLVDTRLPKSRSLNRGYIELARYFHFPEQLLALEIRQNTISGHDDAREMTIEFHIEGRADDIPEFPDGCFVTNVVPAANIFRIPADPLVIDHTREEYIIRPQDGKRRFIEILNVEKATALFPGGKTIHCIPYEAYDDTSRGMLYTLRYRFSEKDGAVEHLLTPIYRLDERTALPDRFTLSMELLCCNHTLPASLQIGDVCRPTDSSPSQAEYSNITTPAPMLPRHNDETLQWRFLSHMNTNLLSMASRDALKGLLELYLPSSSVAPELSAANHRRLQSILDFTSRDEERLFRGRLLRGRLLTLKLDSGGFMSEGDLFLFANALERFFAQYSNLNTYSRLHLLWGGMGDEYLWPPRLGEKQLI
ncbi:MAG: type VI secretion system baseplate subunit TssF [Desulfovibrio sp.]|nr:type VI secretion system baseplate subunit TssF [Desulfovibrio sp.]